MIPDLEIKEQDCKFIEPFELDDISILDTNFHHEYPEYEIDEIPEFELGENL
ncbi:MAG: hypothetical protein ACOCZ5_00775 [bacterium]